MPAPPTPKDRFTSLDTLAVVRELRALRRARVDKVFDRPGGGWAVTFRVPQEGRRELQMVPGRFAALLAEPGSHAEELGPYARELRRLLEGTVLHEVPEPGGERLLELVLRRTDDPQPVLVSLEMFGTGNLVVARAGTIVAAAHTRRWAHRTVGVGATYARPPTRADPFTIGAAEIEAELARSRTDLASTLGARLALGGPIAEELIARGGWDGSAPAAADPGRLGAELHRTLQTLLLEVGDRPAGFLYRREGVVLDATPYRSARWKDVPQVEELPRASFSVAAAEYFASLDALPVSPEEQERTRTLRELQHQLERQRVAVLELERRIADLKADASAVFDHYAEAEAALADASRGNLSGPSIEARLGERTVSLLLGETPRAAAQRLFEEAKRTQSKLAGATSAVREAEAKMAELEANRPTRSTRPSAPLTASAGARRTRWFERYRWFISSEGAVVVAGRDASSNDSIVRRHLKEQDLYVHADLHGAASVVIKHPLPGSRPITDVTCREAGQWAVAFSKAWRAGLASASAFWVTHEQVSKAAASGEFVARGAWVIHGTKNILKDLPTELGLGTIDYEGEALWCAAPPEAIRARGTVRVLLTPGPEREREEREKELVRELGLPRPRLQSLLPAGGLTIRRP